MDFLGTLGIAITIIFTIVVSIVTIKTIVTLIAHYYKYGINAASITVTIFCIIMILAMVLMVMHYANEINVLLASQRTEPVQHVYIDD